VGPRLGERAELIVSFHIASGAAGGALAGSRARAVPVGLLLHLLGDLIPHRDIPSRRFEIASGLTLLALIAARRGVTDPAVVGGAFASAPDLEHVLPFPRPGGRKLFPSHRFSGWHQEGGVPAWAQLLAAGVMAGWVLRSGQRG
jgi:hypothetical protein